MLKNTGTIIAISTDPMIRHLVGGAVVTMLALMVSRMDDVAYIEWPEGESLANVTALIEGAERDYGVVFDLEDTQLMEPVFGGFRLHGMFMDEFK